MPKLISLGSLFRKTLSIYQRQFGLFFFLSFIPFGLFLISPLLVQTIDFLYLPFSLLLTALSFLALVLVSVALIIIIDKPEEEKSLKEIFNQSQKFIWPMILVSLSACFVILGASYLFIIPGLIFALYFLFIKFIVVLEQEKNLNILVKSREYVRDYFWPITGRFLVITISLALGYFVLNFITSSVADFFASSLSPKIGEVALLLLEALVNIVLFPIALIATYLIYSDLKKIKGEISIEQKNKQAWLYLAIGLAGWVFLLLIVILSVVVFTSAIGGYLLGTFVSEIFNSGVLTTATSSVAL